MKITYDSQADALYIGLRDTQAHDNVELEEGVSADLDTAGHVIGFEILDASKRLTAAELHSLHVENLTVLPGEEAARVP